jgi:hypothetical protein
MDNLDTVITAALAGWAAYAIYRAGVRKGRSEIEEQLQQAENIETGSGFIAMHAVAVANREMTVQEAYVELQGWEALGVVQGVSKAWLKLTDDQIMKLGEHSQRDPKTRSKIEAFMIKMDEVQRLHALKADAV